MPIFSLSFSSFPPYLFCFRILRLLSASFLSLSACCLGYILASLESIMILLPPPPSSIIFPSLFSLHTYLSLWHLLEQIQDETSSFPMGRYRILPSSTQTSTLWPGDDGDVTRWVYHLAIAPDQDTPTTTERDGHDESDPGQGELGRTCRVGRWVRRVVWSEARRRR